jgi:Uncharacterised nucleotidyltransferase
VARALAGSWRCPPPSLDLAPDEIDEIVPLLLTGWVGPLLWWRLRQMERSIPDAASALQRAYVVCAMQAARQQHDIKAALGLLRSAGVDPILVKGWANARLYAEPGLRPYSDIDLCVRPDEHAAAERALSSPEARRYGVDLHLGFDHLDDRSWDELNERTQVVRLDDQEVRVLGLEDHVHILSVHLLRHGGWRPLWLCDIAVALEGRSAVFDWSRCLGPDRRRADWVACTIGAAHHLLGLSVEDTPVAARARRMPPWLVPAFLRRWDWSVGSERRGLVAASLLKHLRNPSLLLDEIRFRWDHPIQATVRFQGEFDDSSRLPFQVRLALAHLPELLRQVGSGRYVSPLTRPDAPPG